MHINLSCVLQGSYYFLKDFSYLFVDRRKGREKERQRYITVSLPVLCPPLGSWPETQACAPTGNRTCGPLVHRLALSPQSHTSQGRGRVLIIPSLHSLTVTVLSKGHPVVLDMKPASSQHPYLNTMYLYEQ